MVHVAYKVVVCRPIRWFLVMTSIVYSLQCGGACKGAKKVLLQSGFRMKGAFSSVMPKGVEHPLTSVETLVPEFRGFHL